MKGRTPSRYFQVLFDYNATSPAEVARASAELDQSQVVDGRPVTARVPVRFSMLEGDPVDYQQNDLGWHLCSAKMMRIIDEGKSPNDDIGWLQAVVSSQDGREHRYYVLHFPRPLSLDILDKRRTVYNLAAPGRIIKAVLDPLKVAGHKVFTYEGGFEPWYVSLDIRDVLLAAHCRRMEYLEG